MNAHRLIVCLSAALTGFFHSAMADTVFLRNGNRIAGHIISESKSSYTVETGSTNLHIPVSMIDRVVKYEHRDTSLVLLGDEMVRQQDYDMARRYYERARAVTKSPEVIEKRIEKVEELVLRKDELSQVEAAMKSGEYRLAADLCLALVEGRRDDAFAEEVRKKASDAYTMLAREYYDSVRTEDAVFEMRRAIELDPMNPRAHGLAGLILVRTGKYRTAREELLLAQELDPGDPLAVEGLKMLTQTEDGLAELASARSTDDTKLDELMGESHFTGHNQGIIYGALTRGSRPIEPVHFDMNAIARRSAGSSEVYQFRSTRALSIFLQAYNAGPGAAAMYNGNVPYRETVNYVSRVAKAIEDITSGRIGPTPYDQQIEACALQFGFHPTLIKAIVKVESNFNPKCVSTADARGLIQLVRVDWDDTMRRLKQEVDFEDHVFDPELNLLVGCHYLRWLVDECLPKYFREEFG